MVQLKLRRFDMSSINDDSIVVMLGKRRTGKSYLVKDLLWYHQDLPVGTVVSPTECVNEFYSSIVPSLFIHDAVTPELLASFVRRQRLITKRMTRDIARMGASKIDPRAFLLLDDCLYDKTWANNEQIRFLFMNGRHIKSLVLITMQYPLGIPPNLRTNIDYTFILRENNVSIQKRIFDNYAGMFPNFQAFSDVLSQTTSNHECLVIHNGSTSSKLEDQVFWYRAEPKGDFRIGAPEFWRWHQELCENADDDDGEDLMDASKMRSARAGPLVNVKKTL